MIAIYQCKNQLLIIFVPCPHKLCLHNMYGLLHIWIFSKTPRKWSAWNLVKKGVIICITYRLAIWIHFVTNYLPLMDYSILGKNYPCIDMVVKYTLISILTITWTCDTLLRSGQILDIRYLILQCINYVHHILIHQGTWGIIRI